MTILVDGIDVSEIVNSNDSTQYRGRVRFRLELLQGHDALKLEVPFRNARTLDDGLRAGLYILKLVGEQLAQDAQQTASAIGHDLKDVHQDGP